MARDIDVAVRKAAVTAAIDLCVFEFESIIATTLRNLPEPWAHMTDEQQDLQIQQGSQRARDALSNLVEAVGSAGFTRIPALLDSFNQGKLNVAKLIVPDDADRHALGDAKGSKVTIVLTYADVFDQAKSITKEDVDSRQGDLLAQAAAHIGEADGDSEPGADGEGDGDPESTGDGEPGSDPESYAE